MANGASDGSIIIDTGLDNSGFEKGSAKMEQSIKGVTQAINKTGQAAASSMQPLISSLDQVGKSINATAQTANNLNGALTDAVSSSDFGRSMNAAGRSCTSLEKQMVRLSNSERMGIKTGSQMTRFQINVEKARDSVTRLEQELQRLGSQRVATPEYESLSASAKKAEQALFRLYDRRDTMSDLGVKETSREWQRLAVQIKNAEYVLESYEQNMKSMRANGSAYTTGADSAKYRQTEATLARMTQQLAHYEQMASQFDTVSGPATQSESSLKKVDKELQRKPKDAGKASSAFTAFGNTLKKAASAALKMTGSLAKLSFKTVAKGAKTATSSISKFFSKAEKGSLTSKGLVKSLTSLKRMMISRVKEKMITALMQSLSQSMIALAKYSSEFNASMSSMKNAATGMGGNLAVTFGNLVNAVAPALTAIINWLSTAISYLNAFFALLSGRSSVTVAKKQTDSYAKSLGGAAGAAKDLKKEVYGFDELNKASSDSGGGGGGGGAGDMFEDVSIESLLPTDVQNFFNSIKAAFEAGDWEGIGLIVGNGLNTVVSAVDNWITSITPVAVTWSTRIAQIFNGLVSGVNWPALGNTIANGANLITRTVNAFTTTFDWASFGAKLGAGANGLVSGIDWTALGVFLSTKFRALWTTIYGFVTAFNWSALGNNLAVGANAAFKSINWIQVITGVVTGIFGVWTAIWTAISGFDWVGASETLATGANTAFQSVDWAGAATLFGEGINSVWTAFWTFLSEFDWESAGSNLALAVNTLFSADGPIDWAAAGTSMSDGLKYVMDGINTFLAETDWQQIGTDIATFLSSIDWSGLVTSLSTGIGLALGGLAELLWGLIKNAWDSVVEWWDAQMATNGGDVIAALLSGITTALANIGTWCKENIIDPLIGGIETALGLESGTISQIASDLWTGLKDGLVTAWNTIKEAVTKPFKDFWQAVKDFFGIASPSTEASSVGDFILQGLKDGLVSAWTTLKDSILQPFKDFWQAVKDFFGIASPSTEASSVGDFILQGFGSGLSSGVQAVLDIVSDVFGRIWNAIKAIFGFGGESEESKEAKQAGKDIMTGMKDGIKGDEETVKTEIKNAAKNVLKALRTELGIPESGGASSKSKTAGEGIVTGIKDGITAKGVSSTFTSAANSTWSAVKSALDTAFGMGGWGSTSASKSKYIGEGTVSGIKDGIDSKGVKATFTASASSLLTAVKNAINSALGLEYGATSASKLKYAGEGIVSGVEEGISGKAVSSTFTSVANSLQGAVSSAFSTALGISGGIFSSSSASKFKDVGKAICQGVADGIDANTSTIKNAATRAANAALSAAKKKLGIHSPSKAFAEIGGYMMAGMSNGLNDAKSGVIKTVASIADAVTSGFDGTLETPEIQVASSVLASGMDAVANKLSQIAVTFLSIADALTAVGGFQLPAVAAGRAIPYRTRVEAESPSTGKSDAVTAFTTNFDETMSDQKDLLLEIIDILRKLKIVIDGDSLTRVLTSLQRAQERSYGYGGA